MGFIWIRVWRYVWRYVWCYEWRFVLGSFFSSLGYTALGMLEGLRGQGTFWVLWGT